jgi:uncharacterized protein (TIGR00297 family)
MTVAVGSLVLPSDLPNPACGVIFLSALALAGSDTLASEIGVLSPRTYLITNGKPVPPGTDGGVSTLGHLCAFGAAAYTSVVGWVVLSYLARAYAWTVSMPSSAAYIALPTAIGFLGCQVDSVIGATLERRGLLNKKTNNLVSTVFGGVLAYVILVALGPLPTA